MATAERMSDNRQALNDYIRRELTSASPAVAAPPEPVARFLDAQANTIRTLRAQLVSNPPPVWTLSVAEVLDPPIPPISLHMQLFAVLSADALAQQSRGNHAAAWSDLRAEWILSRSLWDRPEIWSVMTAMGGTRLVTAISPKLDAPAPAWFDDVLAFDVTAPLVHALRYEAWIAQSRADRYPAGEPDDSRFAETIRRAVAPALRPVRVAQAAMRAGRLRETAAAVARVDPCAPFVIRDMREWSGLVRRFNRFRIEREGVAKYLDVKAGRPPANIRQSACAQAHWEYDGAKLAFRGTLPPTSSRVAVIPLTYRLTK